MARKVPVSVDDGAVGAFLVGNYGDEWTRYQKLDWIAQLVALIREQGIIAGGAGHELRTPMAVEKAGIAPDFYMKTLHGTNYWSTRRPGQDREVIDNYGADNYWCKDPQETIRFMSDLERPWIAYKVLAAGAIALVGMFDFQVAECAAIANDILSNPLTRQRDWVA